MSALHGFMCDPDRLDDEWASIDALEMFDLLVALGVEPPWASSVHANRERAAGVYAQLLECCDVSRVDALLACAIHASCVNWWPHVGAVRGKVPVARFLIERAATA